MGRTRTFGADGPFGADRDAAPLQFHLAEAGPAGWRWVRVRVSRWLAAVVVWLSAVTVVAAVAWFAIDSAGREVSGGDHAMSLVSAVQPSPTLATTPANVARTPSPSPTTLGVARPESGIDARTSFVTPSVS